MNTKRIASVLIDAFVILFFLMGLFTWLRSASTAQFRFPSTERIFLGMRLLADLRVNGTVTPIVAIAVTLKRVFYSVLVSSLAGLLAGIVFSKVPFLWRVFHPIADSIRSTPVTFLLPFIPFIAGTTEAWIPFALAALPCAFVAIIHIHEGVARISQERLHAFSLLTGHRGIVSTYRYLLLPSIVPEIATSLRLNVSYSIVVVSVLEYMSIGSAETGFGAFVNQLAQREPDDPRLFSSILVFGFIGYALNKALGAIERRILKWRSDNALS